MKRLLLFTLLLPAMIMTGCKDTGDDGTGASIFTFSMTPTSIPLDNVAQTTAASVVSAYQSDGRDAPAAAWKLTSSETWLMFSNSPTGGGAVAFIRGAGSTTVYLVVKENTGASLRTAEVFANDGTTSIATVKQAGTAGDGGKITVTVAPATIPSMAGDAQVPAKETLAVTCTSESGATVSYGEWTLTSSAPWLTLTLNSNGSGAETTLSGIGTKTVYLVAGENGGPGTRTANITLEGVTQPVSVVTQAVVVILPALDVPDNGALKTDVTGYYGELPSAQTSFVGAFWRATQTGERVIMTNAGANIGDWTATVAWYDSKWDPANGDGVVLAAGDSTDANIRTATPGDAESYKVGGTSSSVTGTVAEADGNIIFRIGLTKEFTAYNANTSPARYAVVKLSYAGNTKNQLIFLRQGEGADYVMRPGDKDDSGANVGDTDNRSSAGKFSPYNMTASAAQWAAANPGGAAMTDYPQLAVRGGTFTEYPSQGGAIFQGEALSAGGDESDKRRAYNHLSATMPTGISATAADYNAFFNLDENKLWKAATNEICPTGWRRPHDGNPSVLNPGTDGASGSNEIKGSELRQSLHLTPLITNDVNGAVLNSVFGYFADGFFDRRTAASGAVDATSVNAGFRGRVFFNPYSYNSIFLPCGGYRNVGAISQVGSRAYYWCSTTFSSTNTPMSCIFVGDAIYGAPYSQGRQMSFSVRCVKE